MNYQAIRRSAVLLGFGYFFITLYEFIGLTSTDIPSLQAAVVVRPAFYVGFTLLGVAGLFAMKEHKYFKASLVSFLILDGLILFQIVTMYVRSYHPEYNKVLSTILNVNYAFNNFFLALGSGLFTNGIKEVYSARKNKRMYVYAMTMEYGVTALILLTTVLSLLDFEGIPNNIAIIVNLVLCFLIYGGYTVFMIVISHTLKEKKIKIQKQKSKK